MDLWKLSMLTGAVAGAVAVAVLGWLTPARVCAGCDRPLPRFRRPGNRREALHGGWTCPSCGCEVDRRGRKIVK